MRFLENPLKITSIMVTTSKMTIVDAHLLLLLGQPTGHIALKVTSVVSITKTAKKFAKMISATPTVSTKVS